MGRAAALQFAREGAKVIGCDINADKDAETAKLVEAAGGHMESLSPLDLTKGENCQKLIDGVTSKHGRIDVLYNNAAMAYFAWIDDHPDDVWYKTIDQELHIVFLLTRAAWPHLKQAGNASIINVGSVSGLITMPVLGALAHAAAKGAVIAMTRQIALEGRKFGVRANTISPGLIETTQTAPLLKDLAWAGPMVGKVMLNRLGQPDEIASMAVFLASDESSYVTGANFLVDGGMTAW
jgi:NAD(P)-dependent dehydrogenase (short-subunit alcohol dehydrogenase family)